MVLYMIVTFIYFEKGLNFLIVINFPVTNYDVEMFEPILLQKLIQLYKKNLFYRSSY